LFSSHPPSEERVDNNRALVNELLPELAGRDMEIGALRYEQAMAFVHENAEAYALFDEAERAIVDNDFDIALLNLDAAIGMVPDEARFTGLKADVYLYQENYREAVSTYDAAISKDANYFDYYLGRGVTHARLGNRPQARTDLEQSSQLLPTAIAMNELGKLTLLEGNRNQAKDYFNQAAQAQGQVGREASTSFIRLDVEDNPGNYISVSTIVDDNRRIFVRVLNSSGLDLEDVTVEVAALIDGAISTRTNRLASLESGDYRDINFGLRIPVGQDWSNDQFLARVLSARVN